MRTSIFFIHPNQPNHDPNHLKRGHLTMRKVGASVSCGHIFLVFYLFIFFFSDVVMASHSGDETKTTSYLSKLLKYAPERAGGGGRKEN